MYMHVCFRFIYKVNVENVLQIKMINFYLLKYVILNKFYKFIIYKCTYSHLNIHTYVYVCSLNDKVKICKELPQNNNICH